MVTTIFVSDYNNLYTVISNNTVITIRNKIFSKQRKCMQHTY